MNHIAIIILLSICTVILLILTIYQYFSYGRGLQRKLKEINENLTAILDAGSDEKLMVFTDHQVLIDLLGQINRLLSDRQRMAAAFRSTEDSSRKMLANISHDIKTPLTVILGYLEIMRLKEPEDQTLIKVEQKAGQVMDLINQFFTLAKLEAGDTDIPLSRINLNEACREAVLDFYSILMQDEFRVDVQIPDEDFFVLGNADAVGRILFNLISNVVRYGSDGKFLGLRVHGQGGAAFVDVIDHGKGIEADFAASVFDRLFTMEDSRNRKIQGNGLGLTIAKNLALQMEGDLYLESVPGRETIFTLQLKAKNE